MACTIPLTYSYLCELPEFSRALSEWNFSKWPECCKDLGVPTVDAFFAELVRNNAPASTTPPTALPFTIVATIPADEVRAYVHSAGGTAIDSVPIAHGRALVATATLETVDTTLPHIRECTPWIASVQVHPSFRRRGVAREVMRHAEKEAFERLYEPIMYIWCEPSLAPFYGGQLGWEEFDRSPYLNYAQVVHMRKTRDTWTAQQ
eukprot:Opistho-2@10335